jgi:hypothetical protein
MRRMTIMAVAALLLAGCGGGAPEPANQVERVSPEEAGNQIAALSEGQRNAVFIRALQDAGEDCQHVESSAPAGEHQGFPVWSARCSDGGNWTIVITTDGTAVVLDADERRLVGDNEAAPQNGQGQ